MQSNTWLYCHVWSLALSWAEQLSNSDSLVKCWHQNQILLHNRYVSCFSSYYLHQCFCSPPFPQVVIPDGTVSSLHAWKAYHKRLNVPCPKEQASFKGTFSVLNTSNLLWDQYLWILHVLLPDITFREWTNFLISLLYKLGGGECRIHQNHLMLPV